MSSWRREMDKLALAQRVLINIGIGASNAGFFYSITSLGSELDVCSFAHGSQFFAGFSGDTTSCRNNPDDAFFLWPTGGDKSFNQHLIGILTIQLVVQIVFLAGNLLHFKLKIAR